MTQESDDRIEGVRKIRQLGGTEITVAGRKLGGGTVILTSKNLTLVPAYGIKQIIALRSIANVELTSKELIIMSSDSELARFGIYERKDGEGWVKDIESTRIAAERRGESIQDELSAVTENPVPQWVYLAGNPSYPDSFATALELKPNGLWLSASVPPLLISYSDIDGFELIPSKQLTATRIFLAGPLLASAWKKMEWYLSIRYKDDAGITLSLLLEPTSPKALEEFMPALYRKMREARMKQSS